MFDSDSELVLKVFKHVGFCRGVSSVRLYFSRRHPWGECTFSKSNCEIGFNDKKNVCDMLFSSYFLDSLALNITTDKKPRIDKNNVVGCFLSSKACFAWILTLGSLKLILRFVISHGGFFCCQNLMDKSVFVGFWRLDFKAVSVLSAPRKWIWCRCWTS